MNNWDNTWNNWEKKVKCHTGNTVIYQEPNGGSLMIGGWSNDAVVTHNTHVIDLTGLEHKFYEIPTAYDKRSMEFMPFLNTCAGWLSLPFPDFGTPSLKSYEQWHGIAMIIQKILQSGTDVLVACHGGHGRSGLFCAIVGYILGINSNRSWSSPVEHIRKIHCVEAVETIAQEKFVYDVLGLSIQIAHVYAAKSTSKICPICGTNSYYIDDLGMCMGCKTKFENLAPVVDNVDDNCLKNPLAHNCTDGDKCIGIYKAKICGHVIHNKFVVEGLCETCWEKANNETPKNQKEPEIEYGACAICQRSSSYGAIYGICYTCQRELLETSAVDYVHDSILDNSKAVPHYCEESRPCLGVMAADVCKHVVHDRDIVDGLCPHCFQDKNERMNK